MQNFMASGEKTECPQLDRLQTTKVVQIYIAILRSRSNNAAYLSVLTQNGLWAREKKARKQKMGEDLNIETNSE